MSKYRAEHGRHGLTVYEDDIAMSDDEIVSRLNLLENIEMELRGAEVQLNGAKVRLSEPDDSEEKLKKGKEAALWIASEIKDGKVSLRDAWGAIRSCQNNDPHSPYIPDGWMENVQCIDDASMSACTAESAGGDAHVILKELEGIFEDAIMDM